MKRRRETLEVFEALHATLGRGGAGAIAVVFDVEGSAYRRPGALFFTDADGNTAGGISGGCLEEDVRLHALQALEAETPRVVTYDTSSTTVSGLGLGCDGQIRLLVRPFEPAEADRVAAAVKTLRERRTVAVVWEIAEDRPLDWAVVTDGPAILRRNRIGSMGERALRDGADRMEPGGEGWTFAAVLPPAPRLVICGAGDDGLPIARLAASVGFDVQLVDRRSREVPVFGVGSVKRNSGDIDGLPTGSQDMVLIKTHSFMQDVEWLRSYLATPVGYIGVMGPRSRIDRLREEAGGDARVYGPTGLDLGGRGREQVAVSVVAELLAVHHGRGGGHLRDRARPIHAAR